MDKEKLIAGIEEKIPKLNFYGFYQCVGILASVGTGVSSIPQLFKIIKEKNAEGVSFGMLLFLIIGTGLWVYYGILKKGFIIIIANSFSFLLNLTISILKIAYR